MPPEIRERFDRFEQWLRKLTDNQLLGMLHDAQSSISNKEFISRWGLEAFPFSNWKRDFVRKELERRELI